MGKHTPGPWEWYSSNSYNRLGTSGRYCELLYPVVYKDGHPGIEWRNEMDARLIAAAPELLEALRKLTSEAAGLGAFEFELRGVIGNTNYNVLGLRINEARAAIAKATGE